MHTCNGPPRSARTLQIGFSENRLAIPANLWQFQRVTCLFTNVNPKSLLGFWNFGLQRIPRFQVRTSCYWSTNQHHLWRINRAWKNLPDRQSPSHVAHICCASVGSEEKMYEEVSGRQSAAATSITTEIIVIVTPLYKNLLKLNEQYWTITFLSSWGHCFHEVNREHCRHLTLQQHVFAKSQSNSGKHSFQRYWCFYTWRNDKNISSRCFMTSCQACNEI